MEIRYEKRYSIQKAGGRCMTYREFLENKIDIAPQSGIEVILPKSAQP